jgi:hypothetical protein
VYDLHDKQMSIGLYDVLSWENMTCSTQISATYGVQKRLEVGITRASESFDQDAILKLSNAKPDIETATQRAFERAARHILNQHAVRALTTARDHDHLEKRIQEEATNKTREWGQKSAKSQ